MTAFSIDKSIPTIIPKVILIFRYNTKNTLKTKYNFVMIIIFLILNNIIY